eukprot:TRINITY_DN19201_c0_g1_i4.p1 TRINITY_DN19201_c0_g1~~TRINITY_DN19201_c0_g1_i4.p1  ORF type:complete len:204 (+),score=24.43 TRINITY_DN19201_c0_g1_i4:211-822(+)
MASSDVTTWKGLEPYECEITPEGSDGWVCQHPGRFGPVSILVQPCDYGLGAFVAHAELPEGEVIGVCPGRFIDVNTRVLEVDQYARKHRVDEDVAGDRLSEYMWPTPWASEHYLAPLDGDGQICAEFKHCQALYLNEPTPSQEANAHHVFNFDLERIELRTAKAVAVGQPLLVYYGEHYARDYPVNAKSAHPDMVQRNGVLSS